MNRPKELSQKLLQFVQSCCDLASSIEADVADYGQISDETVLYLHEFTKQHEELETILDILNGIQ